MITRLYLDNFRSFDNFEFRPGRQQLIFGGNGTGKSSLVDALLLIRQISIAGVPPAEYSVHSQSTRWLSRSVQTYELEAALEGVSYLYRLVLEPLGDPPRTRIAEETVTMGGAPLFGFAGGEVRLYNDALEHHVTYPFDEGRSAFATIAPRHDNQKLTRFKRWLASLFCFRVNPFAISSRAETESLYPNVQFDNFASWYRHLAQADQRQNFAFRNSLQEVLDEFEFLELQPFGENVRVLIAEFSSVDGPMKYLLSELSEGQRCLICLYAILHFLLAKGSTVIIDEPDNFISLREIQPWLTAVSDAVIDAPAQILIVSHHPEIIDQWAPAGGIQFLRERGGPTRLKAFSGLSGDKELPPSELIARGWIE